MQVDFESELWVWDARKGETWTFVTLPAAESDEIMERSAGARRGFGSVRVRAAIGTSSWSTSIFPDTKRGAYVLPVKQAIRKAQSLAPGSTAKVRLDVLLDPPASAGGAS